MAKLIWTHFGLPYDRVVQLPADTYGELVEYVLNEESRARVEASRQETFQKNLARYLATTSVFGEHQDNPSKFMTDTYNALLADGEIDQTMPELDKNNPFFQTAMRASHGELDTTD